MNKIVPGSVKRINKKGGNFALMENIAAFQKGLKAYGVPEEEVFQTADLFEARNVKAVSKSLFAFGRTCLNKGYAGPTLGPKMSEKHSKEWSEDQLREGRQGTIGLQAGSNKGASQAGLNIGKGRSITDDK